MGGDLPVAAAFERALPGSGISTVICVIAMAALIKTWNAMHLGASRIMLAQARSGALPAFLAEVSPATGAPRPAAIMVGGLTFLGIIAGRGAILPIISMSTMCTTIIAVLALVSLMRLRKADLGDAAPDYVFPGGDVALTVITIGAAIVAAAAIAAPFGLSSGMPVEIVVLLGWLAIACVVLIMRARRIRPDARSPQA
jgi:APA family basic amino acid/polyamine antiporter